MSNFEGYLSDILSNKVNDLNQSMYYAVFPGGKRIRSSFLQQSFICFADEYVKKIGASFSYPFAAAIEFIHSYSLVHDDLPAMDNDDMRRGKLSVHKKYGETMAILAGDALLNLAYETMISSVLNEKNTELIQRKVKAMNSIAVLSGYTGMVGGQAIDVVKKISDYPKEDNELLEMIGLKTACLIIASLEAGSFLGKPSFEETEAIKEFGYSYGIAFQIADDISDYEKDLNYEKPTYATVYGKKNAVETFQVYMNKSRKALRSLNRDVSYFSNQLDIIEGVFNG